MTGEVTTLREGRYALCGVLGEGSQGETLKAVDKATGTLVAIKRFQVRGAKSWKDVELAEREARVLSGLQHPALPRYIDYFEEGGCLYLVMELIEGQSLRELSRCDTREVLRFLQEIGAVLEFLHGLAPPVFHRDLKPSNILRRPNGAFALVDFGSVRDRLKPDGGSTVVGTFGYMAPEQFQGRAFAATDVYAAGVTALRMLTGVEPDQMPHRGLTIDVRALLGAQAAPELVTLFERLLDPNPDTRASRIGPVLSELRLLGAPPSSPHQAARGPHGRDSNHEWTAPRPEFEVPAAPFLPPPLVAIMLLGLLVARIASWWALAVVVPTVLFILSGLVGPWPRHAAHAVRRSAPTVDGALRKAGDWVRGGSKSARRERKRQRREQRREHKRREKRAEWQARTPSERVRVGVPDAQERRRVRVDDEYIDADGQELDGDRWTPDQRHVNRR